MGMLAVLAPILFILIWSTGFIVARAAVPHAAPELFLVLRLGSTSALLGAMALLTRQPWPPAQRTTRHLGAGAALHGLYLCLSWWAVSRGMPAGVMSLLGALQPLLVALASFFLFHERLSSRGWAGLAIAIVGVICVLAPALQRTGLSGIGLLQAGAGLASIIAMAVGTLIQRGSIGDDPIWVSGALQNIGGLGVALTAAGLIGDFRWDSTPILWGALAWSVLGLSAGGLSLLVWMVRHQGATRVSALLLLVPPLAAVEAWWLFGEMLGPLQIAGFGLALGGVLLSRVRPRPVSTEI